MKEMDTDNANTPGPEGGQGEPVAFADPGELTPEQLDELKQRSAKADEYWDRLLRTTAEFDNFRKRATREKQEAIRYANEGILEKLVPVLDNFDMALTATQNAPADTAQSLQAGVNMILQQLKRVLAEALMVAFVGVMMVDVFADCVTQRSLTKRRSSGPSTRRVGAS